MRWLFFFALCLAFACQADPNTVPPDNSLGTTPVHSQELHAPNAQGIHGIDDPARSAPIDAAPADSEPGPRAAASRFNGVNLAVIAEGVLYSSRSPNMKPFHLLLGFQQENDRWIAVSEGTGTDASLPQKAWHVFFNGAIRGSLESEVVEAFSPEAKGFVRFAESGLPRSLRPRPTAGKHFYSESIGGFAAHPLTLVDDSSVSDPDRWVRTVPSELEIERLEEAFVKVVGDIPCGQPEPDYYGEATRTGFRLETFYVNRDGRRLFSMGIECEYEKQPNLTACGAFIGQRMDYCTNTLIERGAMQFVNVRSYRPKRNLEMEYVPLEAGDFDQDGESEWLFHAQGYMHGGLAILDDEELVHSWYLDGN